MLVQSRTDLVKRLRNESARGGDVPAGHESCYAPWTWTCCDPKLLVDAATAIETLDNAARNAADMLSNSRDAYEAVNARLLPLQAHAEAARSVQSRTWSLGETVFSTVVGFAIAYATTAFVMPLFGYPVSVADNLGITSIFTVVSIIRGYCVRRLFNWLTIHQTRV